MTSMKNNEIRSIKILAAKELKGVTTACLLDPELNEKRSISAKYDEGTEILTVTGENLFVSTLGTLQLVEPGVDPNMCNVKYLMSHL